MEFPLITHTILYFQPSDWFMNKTPRIITRHFGQGSTQLGHRRLLWTTRRSNARGRRRRGRRPSRTSVDGANDDDANHRLRGVSISARQCRIDDDDDETESDDDDDVDGNDGTARE